MSEGGFTMKDGISGRLALLAGGVEERAHAAMEDFVDQVESYAQENAPWSDITGDARAGLTASVSQEGTTIYLELYHTVEHGIWLEIIQSGRFAIIMPTLEYYAGQIFSEAGAKAIDDGGG